MKGRIVSKAGVFPNHASSTSSASTAPVILDKSCQIILPKTSIPSSLSVPRKRTIQILLLVDFDTVSGRLGTGAHSDNDMADYSSGHFTGNVGVPRLLKLFRKYSIASSV